MQNSQAKSAALPDPRTGGHVRARPGALIDCCSDAAADRSGSARQVAAWATKRKGSPIAPPSVCLLGGG
jgi:hypothetical protein